MQGTFPTVDKKTNRPLKTICHGQQQSHNSKLQETDDENEVRDQATINKFRHPKAQNATYQIFINNDLMNPIEINENFIREIQKKLEETKESSIFFKLFNAHNPSNVLTVISISKTSCEKALSAEAPELQPQKKISKKPQKVCVDQQEKVHKIPLIYYQTPIDINQPFRPPFASFLLPTNDESVDKNRILQNIASPYPTANRKDTQENLEILNALIDQQNNKARKAYFSALADPMIKTIQSINTKSTSKEKPEDLLTPKQKEINNFAAEIVCHYWQTVQDNEHLDCSTFEKYAQELKNAIRKNDRDRSGLGETTKTAQAIMCEAEKIIKQVDDTNQSYNKTTKKLNAEPNKNPTIETFNTKATREAKKVIGESLLVTPIQVATGTISKQMGRFGAYLILDYFDNPQATKEKKKIEKKKIKIEEKLKTARESEKTAEQEHTKKLLKKATKSKKALDSMNQKKLTQAELLQKIEDLHAKY